MKIWGSPFRVDAKAIWLYPPPGRVEVGPRVCINVGVMDGIKIVGIAVMVGVAVSTSVAGAVFVLMGRDVRVTSAVAVAVAGRGVGVTR
jgi:hypothetical protein